MAASTHAIRKGFEYQDLQCALRLLDLLATGDLSVKFRIESDDVQFVDDLRLRWQDGKSEAHQIKFHVSRDNFESFSTLVHRRANNSRSLLQKLFRGWDELTSGGERETQIIFTSSSYPAQGPGELGSAIDTDTDRIGGRAFGDPRLAGQLATWREHLGASPAIFRNFIEHMQFKLGAPAIEDLMASTKSRLAALSLPSSPDAISILQELIGRLATRETEFKEVKHLVFLLWERTAFRDACEKSFAGVLEPLTLRKRAREVRIATVSLLSLPAFLNRKFACIEEPVPLPDYSSGLTATDLSGPLDALRENCRTQYVSWQRERIRAILERLIFFQPDLVVFPRFSIPFELLDDLARWAQRNACNVVAGGHSLEQSANARAHYQALTDGDLAQVESEPAQLPQLVIDVVIRHDRAGRSILSICPTPHAKIETLKTEVTSFELPCRDGWLDLLNVPSASALTNYLHAQHPTPECISVSCGVHHEAIYSALQGTGALSGVPLIICSSSTNAAPLIAPIDANDSRPRGTDEWEGVLLADIDYDRNAGPRWTAKVSAQQLYPIVYHESPAPADHTQLHAWLFKLTGCARSVGDAKLLLESASFEPNKGPFIIPVPSPSAMFGARAAHAEQTIKGLLSSLEPQQIAQMGAYLSELRRYRAEHVQNLSSPVSFQTTGRSRAATPPFVDRAVEAESIQRFAEGSEKRVLFLHGPPGVGKRALLADVQRKYRNPAKWLRLRCVPDATFPEAIGQFLTKLGDRTDDPPTMDRETFERFIRAAASTGCDVIVFEQAQHLPLNEDSRNHPDLLGFLSQICGTDIRPLPRVILVSDLRGRLNFSGQHLLADIPLDGLAPPYDVELIRELLVSRPSSYDPPTSSELSTIVSQIHGHPMLTEIAASLLESYPASAVATTLHRRAEIRQYINTSLLGKLTLSAIERRFLLLASVFRIPVAPFAFAPISGAHTRSLTQDLVSRFLLHNDRDGLRLHPLLRDHFQQQITDQAEEQQLNELAFQYFEQLRKSARLSLDEQIEHIYHGQRCGAAISLHEVRILVSPIRSQMFQALSDRQYARVESAANKILELDPRDSVARLAMATALDARGRHREADTYFDSICDLDRRHRWVAIALAKSKIRTRDFQAAEHVLSEMQYRFGNGPWLDVVWAQLFEARGKLPEAEEKCVAVLKDQYCHPSDAFMSTLLLRAMNRFDLITAHLERHMPRFDQNDGIKRLFAHACVVSHFAPEDGLRFLNDLWVASPEDGRIIGDLAGALAAAGRVRPAEQLFRKGLLLCRTLRNDRPALLEEYARFLDTQDRFRESHTQYRELLGMRPHHTHLLRLFASSLLRAAAAAKASRDRVAEDAFAVEAKQVLSQLLQVAPEDSWASSSLEDAIHRNYGP